MSEDTDLKAPHAFLRAITDHCERTDRPVGIRVIPGHGDDFWLAVLQAVGFMEAGE